jgi:hypothetical protein
MSKTLSEFPAVWKPAYRKTKAASRLNGRFLGSVSGERKLRRVNGTQYREIRNVAAGLKIKRHCVIAKRLSVVASKLGRGRLVIDRMSPMINTQ